MSAAATEQPQQRDPGTRRRAALVLAAVLLASLVLALVLVRAVAGDDEAPARAVDTAMITPGPPPREPVRLPQRGSVVDAVVQRDGTVEVTHWIRTSRALDQLTLRAYDSPQIKSRPRAVDLKVRTSQGTVAVSEPEVGAEPRMVDLVRPTLLVRLRYTVTGVASTSPLRAGRTLLGTVALDTGYGGAAGPRRVQIGGRRVLDLVCTPADGGVLEQRSCGEPREDGWSVNLPPRSRTDHVAAQVDLERRPRRNPAASPG